MWALVTDGRPVPAVVVACHYPLLEEPVGEV